jgi:nitrite reductase/ring-hydroxylating ferredoxin subunit
MKVLKSNIKALKPYFVEIQNGVEAFVFLNEVGDYSCFKNICPHMNIPLDYDDHDVFREDLNTYFCKSHGAQFSLDNGECISGPCLGKSLINIDLQETNKEIRLLL